MRVALVSAVSAYPTLQAPGEPVDPPLGLLGLATLIRADHDIKIFDGQLYHCTPRRMAADVLRWNPDVVGFSVNFSTLARTSREMAEWIREQRPDVRIVFGGNYTTFNWPRLIRGTYIDHAVLHEAELTFPAVLSHLEDPSQPMPNGTVSRTADGHQARPFGAFVSDLDSLPFCDFELFDDPANYVKAIVSSRGCPYTCIYCSTKQMWQKWRCRSAHNVADEMLELADTYDTNQVLFADDTFLVREDRALELCGLLRSEGSPVLWGFSTRFETIKDHVIPTLAEAGVRWIFFGCESGSDRVLKLMKRHYTQAEMLRKIRLCAEHGITCTASFIVGLPWDREEDVRQTFHAMRNVATHRVLLNIFTPLAGTLSLDDPAAYGIRLLHEQDPERMVVGHGYVGYETEHLTAERIKELWLEGQAIVMDRGREKPVLEAQIERRRYGLMGDAGRRTEREAAFSAAQR